MKKKFISVLLLITVFSITGCHSLSLNRQTSNSETEPIDIISAKETTASITPASSPTPSVSAENPGDTNSEARNTEEITSPSAAQSMPSSNSNTPADENTSFVSDNSYNTENTTDDYEAPEDYDSESAETYEYSDPIVTGTPEDEEAFAKEFGDTVTSAEWYEYDNDNYSYAADQAYYSDDMGE